MGMIQIDHFAARRCRKFQFYISLIELFKAFKELIKPYKNIQIYSRNID